MPECASDYACPITQLAMTSSLEVPSGVADCTVGRAGDGGMAAHVLEMTHLGKDSYEVKLHGGCSDPLHFPDAANQHHWETPAVWVLPQRKLAPRLVKERLVRAGMGQGGLVRHDIEAWAEVIRVSDRGWERPINNQIPRQRLRFGCELR